MGKTKVVIKAEWGSDFQKVSMMTSLIMFLEAWEKFYQSKHKGNKIVTLFKDEK